MVPFLQNRSDTFILNYLDKFKPMRFDNGDVIFEANAKAREMYVNVGGEVLNTKTHRVFMTGSLIGVDDILFNRNRLHRHIAKGEVFTLKLDRDVFDKMMKEFPDIKQEILEEANLRSVYQKNEKVVKQAI